MIYYLLLSILILFIILCIIRIHPNSSIKQIIKSNIRMSILTDVILDMVKNDLSTAIKWETAEITPNDMKFLKEECSNHSDFDPLGKRNTMYNNMLQLKTFNMSMKCKYGQVMAIFETKEQMAEIPLELWGHILRMFYEGKPFKVYFLAHISLRKFPENGEYTPENINGGYTYQCNPETIVIYRAEDATRVLIHELQHSCCLDKNENGVDLVEAETEAWAELLYVAILSGGNKNAFNDMLQKQSSWIVSQNARIKKQNGETKKFPWRYTVGKEDVWRRWGLIKNAKYIKVDSLRLTYPPNDLLKSRFLVSKNSTIL